MYSEQITTSFNYQQLYCNLLNIMSEHQEKIDSYKDNISNTLLSNEKKIYTIFFAEIAVVFPSFIELDNKIEYITPLDDINFINEMKKFKNIDGLIIHYDKTSNTEAYNKFILIDEENLNEYSIKNENVYDFSNLKVHDFENPMQTGFIVKVEGVEE